MSAAQGTTVRVLHRTRLHFYRQTIRLTRKLYFPFPYSAKQSSAIWDKRASNRRDSPPRYASSSDMAASRAMIGVGRLSLIDPAASMFRDPHSPRARLGCGFLCVSALLSCIMLAINGLIVMNLMNAVVPALPEEWNEPQITQAIVFGGPLLLLIIEWWVSDVAIDWLRPAKTDGGGGGAG
jgi:hypothetical protein